MPAASKDSTRPAYMLAIIQALLGAGNSARPKAVYLAIEAAGERRYPALATDVDPQVHYENAVRFGRQELADGGLLAPTHGIWTLMEAETARALTLADAVRIIGENRRERERRKAKRPETDPQPHQDARTGDRPTKRERQPSLPRPTTGPKPSRYEASFRREDGPASTYIFRFGASDIWKIGFAGDVAARLNHVNQHVPIELVEASWQLVCSTRWPSQDLAYAMEQQLFDILTVQRTVFERVRCEETSILQAWDQALAITQAAVAE